MALMHDTLSECALQIYEVSLKYLWRLSSYRVDTTLWRTDPRTEARGAIYMQELCFLCLTRRLNVLYKCMKLRWNTSNGYQVVERTRNSIAKNQREITPKYPKAEFWFLCMTRRLNVLYKCMKFRWNIFDGYQVIERTRLCDGQTHEQRRGGLYTCKSCGSCAWHVVWMCFTNVWSFVEIPPTVIKL